MGSEVGAGVYVLDTVQSHNVVSQVLELVLGRSHQRVLLVFGLVFLLLDTRRALNELVAWSRRNVDGALTHLRAQRRPISSQRRVVLLAAHQRVRRLLGHGCDDVVMKTDKLR